MPVLTDSDRMAKWLRLVDIVVLCGSIPTATTFSLQRLYMTGRQGIELGLVVTIVRSRSGSFP
jgi:hypothetical protein